MPVTPPWLVDEFQDTDRLQSEILWRLCAASPDPATTWTEWTLRPGSLFLVGDPKQAIYRFRGADVASYVTVRDRLTARDADARVVVGQNFRSYGRILEWVNERFETPLKAHKQPGFDPLFTTVVAPDGHTAIATLPVEITGGGSDAIRDAEADAVAAFCARVIGALPVRGKAGPRPCQPDDIALLAPSGTELWRYERALEAAGIAVSTQAGQRLLPPAGSAGPDRANPHPGRRARHAGSGRAAARPAGRADRGNTFGCGGRFASLRGRPSGAPVAVDADHGFA